MKKAITFTNWFISEMKFQEPQSISIHAGPDTGSDWQIILEWDHESPKTESCQMIIDWTSDREYRKWWISEWRAPTAAEKGSMYPKLRK